MNTKILKEALQKRFENRLLLEEYARYLFSIGIIEYNVDLVACVVKYIDKKGISHNVPFPKGHSYEVNSTYDSFKVEQANEAMIQGKTSFTSFLETIAEAGIKGYEVNFNTKYITYLSVEETKHVEPFPHAI